MKAVVYPPAWFGAECAEVSAGDTVAVFGCGPVGQLAIASAWRMGAGRVIAVDNVPARLEAARSQHAEPVDFGSEHPVAVIRELTGGTGADRVIDAVGVDAYPGSGEQHTDEVDLVAGGVADPAQLLTQIEPSDDVVKAYRTFDTREPGWVKVALAPVA